jgi:hypothetical protein
MLNLLEPERHAFRGFRPIGVNLREGIVPGPPRPCIQERGRGDAGGSGIEYDRSVVAGGAEYDSVTNPTSLGSGGSAAAQAGRGGAIRLIVSGTLRVDGQISADGLNSSGYAGGGGAGGSVWVTTDTLEGGGGITANGGAGSAAPFGGGGGRIAVYRTITTFSGGFSVAEDAGDAYGQPGQPGTIFQGSQNTRPLVTAGLPGLGQER